MAIIAAPTTTAPYPATRTAFRRSFVIPHVVASSIRPPSSGNPGSALTPPIKRLSQASSRRIARVTPGSTALAANQNAAASTSVVAGPTKAMTNSANGPFALDAVSVAPPQNTRVIPATGRPNPRAAIACAASCSRTPPKNSDPSKIVSQTARAGLGTARSRFV